MYNGKVWLSKVKGTRLLEGKANLAYPSERRPTYHDGIILSNMESRIHGKFRCFQIIYDIGDTLQIWDEMLWSHIEIVAHIS
jgi:hypothetical protein